MKNSHIQNVKKELVKLCFNSYKPTDSADILGSNMLVEEFTNKLGLYACIYINHATDSPYISLIVRGSDEKIDWIQNIDIKKSPIHFFIDEKNKSIKSIDVHRGYKEVYFGDDIGSRIINKIEELYNELKYDIYLSGHSMGGAITQICAFKLFSEKNIKSNSIVFGSPLNIGDENFQEILLKNKIFIIHFNVSSDLVPYLLLPFYPPRYRCNTITLPNKSHKSFMASHSIRYYMELILGS